MPRRPSTTAKVKSLASDAFCKPSSMMMTLAPPRERRLRAGDAVACDDGRRHARQQQRLVADLRGRVGMRIDHFRTGEAAAIAAAQTKRPLAGRLQHFGEHHRGRRLAGAAEREIADAQHRHAGARALPLIRRAAIAP